MNANKWSTSTHGDTSQYCQMITVNQIASDICTIEACKSTSEFYNEMCRDDFDLIGVSNLSETIGYVEKKDLEDLEISTNIASFVKPFQYCELVASNTPLVDILDILCERQRLFVLNKANVVSIVTQADLQKIPFRLFVFAQISEMEILLTTHIRSNYVYDRLPISQARLSKARELYDFKKTQNMALDLFECLQLCDKFAIIGDDRDLVRSFGFSSKSKYQAAWHRIEILRNTIAHSSNFSETYNSRVFREMTADISKISETLFMLNISQKKFR